MWVRSQDKEVLIDVNHINIFDIMGECQIRCNPGVYLGTYSTKEKALKVLDRIHKYLNYYIDEKENGAIHRVFKMPQDSEVE